MENTMLNLIDSVLDIHEQEKDTWKIKSDLDADWALDKIREIDCEYRRMELVINDKIAQLQQRLKIEKEKRDRQRGFFESKLREYFETVNTKETKTQKKYILPTGTLKFTKPQIAFNYNKDKLLKEAEKRNMDEFIKIQKEFDWAEFKKNLEIKGNKIINKNTGEVVELDGLEVVEKPGEFKVEV